MTATYCTLQTSPRVPRGALLSASRDEAEGHCLSWARNLRGPNLGTRRNQHSRGR